MHLLARSAPPPPRSGRRGEGATWRAECIPSAPMYPRAEWPQAKRAPVPPPGSFGGGTARSAGRGPAGRRLRTGLIYPLVSAWEHTSVRNVPDAAFHRGRRKGEPGMMKRILLAAAFAAALAAACGRGDGRGAAADTTPALVHDSVSLWPERGYVVVDSVMPKMIRQCSRETPDSAAVQGWWRPTPAQIRELEARLTPVLREALRKETGPYYNP